MITLGFAEEGEEDFELAGGEAFLGGAVAGGAEGVEEAGGEIDFAGEESARGFLTTAVEIGHSKVLLELVHNNENLNETKGLTLESRPELDSRKNSYYASNRWQDRKREPRQARCVPAVAVSVIDK